MGYMHNFQGQIYECAGFSQATIECGLRSPS